MTDATPRPLPLSSSYALSWLLSLLLHGMAVGATVVLTTNLRVASQPEPFKWNVSILEPPPPVKQPGESLRPRSASTTPVEPEPAKPEPAVQTALEAAPQETQPVVPPAPQPVRPDPQVIARTARPMEPPAPAVTEHPAAPAPAAPTHPASTASAPPLETATRTPEPAPAPASNVTSMAQPKRDYGWLTDSLLARIEQLKRYPAQARLNQWEGKVVLRVVIKDDGHLADLKIVKSSGHDALDQDALEVMRQTFPIALKQPLGQPSVNFHIPIVYQLK